MPRIPIRVKVAAALVFPLLAMGTKGVVAVGSVSHQATQVRDQTELATATIGPSGLITALQNERNCMAAYLVGVDKTMTLEVTGTDHTRHEVDTALAKFEHELRSPAAREAYAPAIKGLDDLKQLRAAGDAADTRAPHTMANIGLTTGLFDEYSQLIGPFFDGMARISIATNDRDLREGASLTETVTRQIEVMPQLANALALPATVPTAPGDKPGINTPDEIAKVARLQT